MKNIKKKIIIKILSFYCKVLFKKYPEKMKEKTERLILITDIYLDKDITEEDWKKNIYKILELKWIKKKKKKKAQKLHS